MGAEQIFGYTAEEVLGVDCCELFSAAGYSAASFERELQTAVESGRSEGESWLVRKSGTRFFARWITSSIYSAGHEPIGYIKVLRDETMRRESEDEDARRKQFARDLIEQQARAASSALGQTQSELVEIGRRLLNVQEEERRPIARDLDDHLAQRLALLDMGRHRLREGLPGNLEELQSQVVVLQNQTAALAQDVREISHRLHPAIIEHLGLSAALRSLCEEYQQSRTAAVTFELVHDGSSIPLEVATAFYRICEEALRNAKKHAGDVPVLVQLRSEGSELQLRVHDDGVGFEPDGVNGAEHLRTRSGSLAEGRQYCCCSNIIPGAVPSTRNCIEARFHRFCDLPARRRRVQPAHIARQCRMIIAEDDILIRHTIRSIAEACCQVVAEAENGLIALHLAEELHRDIAPRHLDARAKRV